MAKRLARCLLAMCLAIGLMPTLAFASEGSPESSDGYIYKDVPIKDSGLTASLSEDGTLSIDGQGAMPDWVNDKNSEGDSHYSKRPWTSDQNKIKKIVIGNGVTRVGALSFWALCGNASEIVLSDTVEEIGYAAFSQTSPSEVVVPASVKKIEGWAFGSRTGKVVFLGSSCEKTGTILYNCEDEAQVAACEAVVKTGSSLAAALESDKTCTTVKELDDLGACGGEAGFTGALCYAYDSDSKTLTVWGSGAMADYSVGNPAPWAGKQIANVVINGGVTKIGSNAFSGNEGLASVAIPTSVAEIGDGAFGDDAKSASFAVAKDSYAAGWLKDRGFIDEPSLDEHGRPYLTADASKGELNKDYVGSSLTIATFTEDGTLTISGEGSMPDWVSDDKSSPQYMAGRPWLSYDKDVKRIVIADGVTWVGKLSFYLCCSNVKEILIADSVAGIGHASFSWQSLPTMVVPAGMRVSSSWAFGTGTQEVVYLSDGNLAAKMSVLYNYNASPKYTARCISGSQTETFAKQDDTCGEVVSYPEGQIGSCGKAPFSSGAYYLYDSGTKTLSIKGAGEMRDFTESDPAPWSSLDVKNVVVSDGVKSIGAHAFCGNAGLEFVSVPDSVASVGDHAFAANGSDGTSFLCSEDGAMGKWLKDNGLAPEVTKGSCGDGATWSLNGTTLEISGTGAMQDFSASNPAPWAKFALQIDAVKAASGITAVGSYAFAGLGKVSDVSVAASVASIGEGAFEGCSSLSKISLPENTEQIAATAFKDCAGNLTVRGYETTKAALAGKLTQGSTSITVEVPSRLKVLFVGNSFSQGAVSQLDQIARSAGVEETLVANLHKSAHPISGYVNNIATQENEYKYTERGTLADASHNTDACNLLYGLQAQDWDVIVVQPYNWQSYSIDANGEQFKSMSGYDKIAELVSYINEKKTNPKAKLAYYMIWSRPFDYLKFDNANDHVWDGEAIEGVTSKSVWEKILGAYDYDQAPFDYFVPAGTAVENARLTFLETSTMKDASTSYFDAVGSGLNADNVHLNSWGNYIVGMTFVKALTGKSIDDLQYRPNGVTDKDAAIAKAAVDAAFEGGSKNAQGNVDRLTYAVATDAQGMKTCYDSLASAVDGTHEGTLELIGMPKVNGEPLTIDPGVTVKTYGSEANHEIVLTNGGKITEAGLVANSGYTLDGAASSGKRATVDPVTGAVAMQDAHAVKFMENDGTEGVVSQGEYVAGESAAAPAAERAGYAFLGWSATRNGEVAYKAGDGVAVSDADVTLYAVWQVEKPTVSVSGGVSREYNGQGLTLAANAATTDKSDAALSYQWYKGESVLDGETQSTLEVAGNVADSAAYRCEVTAADPHNPNDSASASDSAEVAISKAAYPASLAVDKSTLWGSGSVVATPALSELAASKGVKVSGVACVDDTGNAIQGVEKAGSWTFDLPNAAADYQLAVTLDWGSEFSENYEEGSATAAVHVDYYDPSYPVTIDDSAIEGGSVTVSPKRAVPGQKVTLTPKADAGHVLGDLVVKDAKGNELEFTDNGDGTYSFKMPSGKVTVEATFPVMTFPDVDYSQWYAPGVDCMAGKGLMTGYSGTGLFGVGKTLTRGELATILWRNACPDEAAAYDSAAAKDETGIAGSADGMFYTAAANWAVANGVITGVVREDGSLDFAATEDVTFEQLVTILARLCAEPGAVAAAGSDLSAFTDGSDASAWSAASLKWAADKGLVEGYDEPSGKRLAPGEDVARERVAVVLMRAFELGLLK